MIMAELKVNHLPRLEWPKKQSVNSDNSGQYKAIVAVEESLIVGVELRWIASR